MSITPAKLTEAPLKRPSSFVPRWLPAGRPAFFPSYFAFSTQSLLRASLPSVTRNDTAKLSFTPQLSLSPGAKRVA